MIVLPLYEKEKKKERKPFFPEPYREGKWKCLSKLSINRLTYPEARSVNQESWEVSPSAISCLPFTGDECSVGKSWLAFDELSVFVSIHHMTLKWQLDLDEEFL